MKVQITIELGNDAMQSRQDIVDAITRTTDQFLIWGSYYYPIIDSNGCKVGEFNLVKD